MAIKGADLITVGNQILLDRLQTSGPGQVNIPINKIYELGDYQCVGTTLDIPDLSFPLESFDASAEMESLLTGSTTFATDPNGTVYDIGKCLPLDIASQFKRGSIDPNLYNVMMGVGVPYLVLEQLSYKFGNTTEAKQTATLKSDSIFYSPGSIFIQTASGTALANQTMILTNPAFPYKGDTINGTRYALGVTLASGKRLIYGVDFTETATTMASTTSAVLSTAAPITSLPVTATTGAAITAGQTIVVTSGAHTQNFVASGTAALAATTIPVVSQVPNFAYPSGSTVAGATSNSTITILNPVPTTDTVRVMYSSDTVAVYLQTVHAAASATRPAAIKGRDIKVFVGGTAITNAWTGVQDVQLDWKVTLDRDIEFGNNNVVAQDYFIPMVNGTITVRPRNPLDLYTRIAQLAGTTVNEVAGALQRAVLSLEIVLYSPDSGLPLKSLKVPDARFTVPGFNAQVQKKMDVQIKFESDGGLLQVVKGAL